MRAKSSYVFGASIALGAICSAMPKVDAAIVTAAGFTFETSGMAFSSSVTSPTLGPYLAESGTGTFIAVHAATGTVYSSPAGSGSARSLSANNFAAGDYYEFDVPTTAIDSIMVAFDAVSSGTGPKVFSLTYSSTGTAASAYTPFTNYTLNTGTTTAFATAATNSAVHFSFDLSGITALNSAPLASFRLVEADTTTATGGTSRIDNFTISGNGAAAPAVPEPAALSTVALALGVLGGRRRK